MPVPQLSFSAANLQADEPLGSCTCVGQSELQKDCMVGRQDEFFTRLTTCQQKVATQLDQAGQRRGSYGSAHICSRLR